MIGVAEYVLQLQPGDTETSMRKCEHRGRVRPVVWEYIGLKQVPNTVICEHCWGTVNAQAVPYLKYSEREDSDGWYSPDVNEVS